MAAATVTLSGGINNGNGRIVASHDLLEIPSSCNP